jgi:hypothetical protein
MKLLNFLKSITLCDGEALVKRTSPKASKVVHEIWKCWIFFQCPLLLLVTMPFSEWALTFIKWNGEKYKSFSSWRSISLLDVVCSLFTIFLLSSYLAIVKIDSRVIYWNIVLNFQTLQKTRFCNLKLIVPWLFDPVTT